MKKLLLIAAICLAIACKKKTVDADDVTMYKWPLTSATITPAKVVDGKAETNFMLISGPSACLNNNFTLVFSKDGSYAFTSTGPLCDMITYKNAKWTRSGNEFKLEDGFGNASYLNLNGNTMTNNYTFTENSVTYTVKYIYTAKK
ncbi:hypothetical protein DHW03_09340 [Pedobacter yonginense]|uniref:Lipocalin-like domain-containing protein n=1 Tax=Pedobacter yonginense TaxID=651869 RepID=A0A317ELU5_9SPHI|nr:hypothetical protein [Pedobacter yonginense]PWS27771.1 hypothetical protein DHW03_09340 [Pedobacter yonginense]